MLKPLTRSFFVAIAVLSLFVFAASSALGAGRSHSGRTHAGAHRVRAGAHHRAGHAHKAAHQGRHKRAAAPTHPVVPSSPLTPVSPVAPTPPITPVAPVEPVTPTAPIEPVAPTAPSEATPPVAPVEPAPAAPTASFSFVPASPVTGQAVTLDGASSTCPDGPCTYAWSDDGGTTQPIPALWPLGGGQILSFTFAEAGTKYVRLLVTDLLGQTATVEHNVVVKEAPLPALPTNSAEPAVSGTATEGQVLSATTGAWSGSPTSYTFQWQDCNSAGAGCVSIAAATASSYTLGSSDVGHTLRVVVTAVNAGGSTSASSAGTAVVVALAPISEPEPEPEPTPISPPANTTMPAISGTATEGQQLSTTNGAWSGEPTSYTYQWRHCNTSGHSCTNISGATGSRYTLAASDVGETMRVMVTAANSAGSSSMSSPTTAIVTAPAPAAPADTALPVLSGAATAGQTLSATNGSWSGSPTSYTYQWQDCNGAGASCSDISGASNSSYMLGTGDVGDTVRAVVSATNAGGSTQASSAASAVVVAAETVSTPAPANTVAPTISGTATEGSVLTAGKGSWSGSPTAYTYQWQDCNSSGTSCTNVSGATSSSYTLGASDVTHTIRVLVTASNAGGSTQASSAQSATVTARAGTQQTDCFSAPGACGYPDPNYANVGPSSACSSLTSSGALTISTAGATVQNMNITGKVTIAANDVTLTNDCVTVNGKAELGTNAVVITGGKSGTVISHSDISGASATTQSVEEALNNNGGSSNTTADHDYIFNCGECVHGTWKLTNSYVTSNATISTDHYEDIYCNDTTFVAEHDVLINPHEQTANLFCDTNDGSGGPADDHITLTESLLAGAGYSVYPQGNSSSVGSSTMNISDNRVARCLGPQVSNNGGGTECRGGADLNGDFPFGGQYGVDAYIYCPPTSGQVWSDNVWDNNDETIGC